MFTKTAIAAALLGLSLTAAPAFAESMTVRYKDLDLSTPQGQKTLDRRIDAAARQVCGYNVKVTGSNLPSSAASACYKDARTQVQKQVAAAVDNAANNQMGG